MDLRKIDPLSIRSDESKRDRCATTSTECANRFKVFMVVLETRGEEIDVCYVSTCVYCCVFDCDSYCAKLPRSQNLWLDGVVGDRECGGRRLRV